MTSNILTHPTNLKAALQHGVCLHIGCGLHAPEGWDNVDASPSLILSKVPVIGRLLLSRLNGPNWPQNAKYGDVVKGLKHYTNRCDLIFSAHVLEHLSLSDFYTALNHIYSYLKPGGTFRCVVPDLRQTIDLYLSQSADPALAADAARYFMGEGTLTGHAGSRKTLYLRLREALSNSRHQWMWDESSLRHALTQAGFNQVRRCYYGDWTDSRFSLVEAEYAHQGALGIEATR